MKRSKKITALVSGLLSLVLLFGMTYTSPASATVPGINQLVSQSSTGTYPDNNSYTGAFLSGNGRYVAFESGATNLVVSDTNGTFTDVFVRDTVNNTTVLVSINPSGVQFASGSNAEGISHDGRYVLVKAWSTMYTKYILYLRDTVANTTAEVTPISNAQALHTGAVSADGRYVTYDLEISGVGSGAPAQVYVKDMSTNIIKLLSTDASGNPGTGNSKNRAGGLNCSGNIIAFASASPNLPGNGTGQSQNNLFIAETGWGTTKLTNITQIPPTETIGGASDVQVSCDGNIVIYSKSTGGGSQALRKYNRLTGTDELVSKNTSNGSVNIRAGSVSTDGRYVAFLAQGTVDTAYPSTGAGSVYDIYVRDTKTNITNLVSFTVSGNRSGRVEGSKISISADGSSVAFIYFTPETTNAGASLISGLTSGTASAQRDVYKSLTGF